MNILAIETSCDETAISIIETSESPEGNTLSVLANVVVSQIDIHKPYGGVFPALAKREHAKNLTPVLQKALEKAEMFHSKINEKIPEDVSEKLAVLLEREPELLAALLDFLPSVEIPKVDSIAFTQGPGLPPALWVGLNFARAISLAWNKPLIPVNHMEGHLFSPLADGEECKTQKIEMLKLPALALLVSGGHTEIVLMKDIFNYEVIGTTRDDAVGEAFDKATEYSLSLTPVVPKYPKELKISEKAKKILTENINFHAQ